MTGTFKPHDFEAIARQLDASPDHRILRRLQPRRIVAPPDATPVKTAIFLDTETTGLDPTKDEIIEIAMVPFTFSADGRIFEIGEPFAALREPGVPISAEITALTGITAEMVAGKTIDLDALRQAAAPTVLIIAHNAAFDRPFVERLDPIFSTKSWACSMSQVPWAEEGFEGTKLGYLASRLGFFFDGHRAADDCLAAIELLARPLPVSGDLALARLLETARRPIWRIWAEAAPFELKDVLKARRYRWNAEANGRPRAWFIDVPDDRREEELDFLRTEIYRRDTIDPHAVRITAYDRFSDRV